MLNKWSVRWCVATHTLCSAFNPSKCTHTAVSSEQRHSHTHPEKRAANVSASREQLGVQCLAQGSPQSWYWESWLFTPTTDSPGQTWDSNPQPSGYKSDSLTIRPQLSSIKCQRVFAGWQEVVFVYFECEINCGAVTYIYILRNGT